MGSSRALVCYTAFVLVSLSSASKDESIIEQREVPFDPDKVMQEMQLPDSLMMQREVDLFDLFDPNEFPLQDLSARDELNTLNERSQISFGPRSFGGPPALQYEVKFPPSRPTSDNLQAICLNGDRRPRYPNSYFPSSGFSKQKRMANAINNLESWLSTCCQMNQTWEKAVTLCCATQAWELSVTSFCQEDVSVKDRIYDCCRQRDSHMLKCFEKNAADSFYEPTEILPVTPLPSTADFNFEPNNCERAVMTPYRVRGNRRKKVLKPSTSQEVDISFPPGRPTADTIDSLCRNQKLRPLYNVKCLPGAEYDWLARQAKTINRIEKGFKQCCKKKKDVLNCADQKWRDQLTKFCSGENGMKSDFHCCSAGDGANDQFSCFQNISPDPHYNMTSTTDKISLMDICSTHKIIKKTFPVGFPLKSFVSKCCPLSDQAKGICFDQRLKEMSENLCLSRKPNTPAVRRCCRVPSQDHTQCISQILMDSITKAANVLRQKKKKKCPLS